MEHLTYVFSVSGLIGRLTLKLDEMYSPALGREKYYGRIYLGNHQASDGWLSASPLIVKSGDQIISSGDEDPITAESIPIISIVGIDHKMSHKLKAQLIEYINSKSRRDYLLYHPRDDKKVSTIRDLQLHITVDAGAVGMTTREVRNNQCELGVSCQMILNYPPLMVKDMDLIMGIDNRFISRGIQVLPKAVFGKYINS